MRSRSRVDSHRGSFFRGFHPQKGTLEPLPVLALIIQNVTRRKLSDVLKSLPNLITVHVEGIAVTVAEIMKRVRRRRHDLLAAQVEASSQLHQDEGGRISVRVILVVVRSGKIELGLVNPGLAEQLLEAYIEGALREIVDGEVIHVQAKTAIFAHLG